MKNTKKFTILAITIIMLSVSILQLNFLPQDMNAVAKAADNASGDDWLHVKGNQIVDSAGNPVWLTGTNWFGFNTGTGVFDGVWSCNMKEAFQSMADRGINFLRIPVSTQILYEWKSGKSPAANVNDFVNPELEGMNSLELFETAVSNCKEVGIKIMVDVHSPHTNAMGHIHPLWYNGTYTTDMWISTLEWLAEKYKNDDTILAFDLQNEPHGNPGYNDPSEVEMAIWDDSTDKTNWKYAAEQCAKKVLEVNPNLLIMIEGIEVYPKEGYDFTAVDSFGQESKYHCSWWGGNLRGVKDKPIDLGTHQDQLVYSPHDYGPMVFKQPWFYEGFTKESVYEDCWKDNWAFIHEENIAPLLLGEWGGFMDGGDNQKWMEALRDYIVENKIHHTFWCFNANSGDTGGLVMHDFSTWDEEKYALLKPALWQDSSGKFIGLDHQTPLGSNGISLGEYYGGAPRPTPTSSASDPTPTTSVAPSTPTSGNILYGDINDDESVNSTDYSLLRRHLLGVTITTEINTTVADVNADGSLNSTDYALMRRYLLGTIEKFPAEQ